MLAWIEARARSKTQRVRQSLTCGWPSGRGALPLTGIRSRNDASSTSGRRVEQATFGKRRSDMQWNLADDGNRVVNQAGSRCDQLWRTEPRDPVVDWHAAVGGALDIRERGQEALALTAIVPLWPSGHKKLEHAGRATMVLLSPTLDPRGFLASSLAGLGEVRQEPPTLVLTAIVTGWINIGWRTDVGRLRRGRDRTSSRAEQVVRRGSAEERAILTSGPL
ncbi:hypothetical protein B0H12DRAFT_1079599 [Mycena haematopus]|nr:hypothetical protein B0H12DRAFT_1079599 [Mycena haematopus]